MRRRLCRTAAWVAACAGALTVADPAWAQKGGNVCSVGPLWNAPGFTLVNSLNTASSGKRLGLSLAAARVQVSCGEPLEPAVVVAAGSGGPDGVGTTVELFFLDPDTGLEKTYLDGEASRVCQQRISVNLPPLPAGATGNAVWTIDFGNIDNDAALVPDFVTTSRGSQEAWVFLGARNPDGSIAYSQAPPLPRPDTQGSFAYSAALGDLDGDGRDEVAIGAPGTSSRRSPVLGRVLVYRFDGSNFLLWTSLTAPPNDAHWNFGFSVDIGDVIGNGWNDVVASAMSQSVDGVNGAGAVYVYDHSVDGQGGHAWTPRRLQAETLADESYGYRVAIADAGTANQDDGHQGDGILDVIATTGWNGPDTRLDITLGPIPGTSGTPPDTALASRPDPGLGGGWGTGEPTIADVNGDGAPDVLIGAMNATLNNGCNSPGVAYAFLTSVGSDHTTATVTRYRLAAPTADADFAGYGRWVVGVDGTPLVLVTEQGRNIDSTTQGQIYVYTAPQAPTQ